MPIANCIITSNCKAGTSDPIELWSNESGQSPEYMTINIITSDEQFGNKYKVMATLCLPSLWPNSSVSSLQLGLSKALSKHFSLPLGEVFIMTSIVESGRVVAEGHEEKW